MILDIPVVCTTGEHYTVRIGQHLAEAALLAARELAPSEAPVCLVDASVWQLHCAELSGAMAAANATAVLLPAGEPAKRRELKQWLEDALLQGGHVRRDTVLVAIGGGAVCDAVGFLASTLLRGVRVMYLPTTVLSIVDAAVGGKTAVNVPAGKNLVGTFCQPCAVWADMALLDTLPPRHVAAGLAEVIKMAICHDAGLFYECVQHGAELGQVCSGAVLPSACPNLAPVMAAAVAVKARIVQQDTTEHGIRATLNFGHTVGHAIEAATHAQWLHGECVALGMLIEAAAAAVAGHTPRHVVDMLRMLCSQLGLPVTLHDSGAGRPDASRMLWTEPGWRRLLAAIKADKKASAGMASAQVVPCVCVHAVGQVRGPPWVQRIPLAAVLTALAPAVQVFAPVVAPTAECLWTLPGSKSITNRALLCAALASGSCRMSGVLLAEDTLVMLAAVQQLGARVAWHGDGTVTVTGCGGAWAPASASLHVPVACAGTAARFLSAAGLLLPSPQHSLRLQGTARMHTRPMKDLLHALYAAGVGLERVTCHGAPDCLPLTVRGGGMPGGTYSLSSSVSSQFISALLLAAPCATGTVTVLIDEEQPASAPYIAMTIAVMRAFGACVEQPAANHIIVRAAGYSSPSSYEVEADASAASYPAALAACGVLPAGVRLASAADSTQGDVGFLDVLQQAGAQVSRVDSARVSVQASSSAALHAATLDMADITDTFLTYAACAPVMQGVAGITGVANQRVKECNRIDAICHSLAQLGLQAHPAEDGLSVRGSAGVRLDARACVCDTHKDHRMAMAIATASLAAQSQGADGSRVAIADPTCVGKTVPWFWEDLALAGVRVEPVYPEAVSAIHRSQEAARHLPRAEVRAVVLVGMRGVGKSSIAHALCRAWGPRWSMVDTDELLCERLGVDTCSQAVEALGWDEFRAVESVALADGLARAQAVQRDASSLEWRGLVLATGGGVVELPENRAALSRAASTMPVVWLQPTAGAHASDGHARPAYAGAESYAAVAARRAPLYRAVSSLAYVLQVHGPLAEPASWDSAARPIARALQQRGVAAGPGFVREPVPLTHAVPGSVFACMSVPDVVPALAQEPVAAELQGIDALEIRLDALAGDDLGWAGLCAVSHARYALPEHVHIIATLRTSQEGGAWPAAGEAWQPLSSSAADDYRAHVAAAMKWPVDYVDVEAWALHRWPQLLAAAAQAGVAVIASLHEAPRREFGQGSSIALDLSATTASLLASLEACGSMGMAAPAVLKLVRHDTMTEPMPMFHSTVADWPTLPGQALLAFVGGASAALTRLACRSFTPVRLAALRGSAVGQCTASEVWQWHPARADTARYALWGHPVAASGSPAMQNAAFHAVRVAGVYMVQDCQDAASVVAGLRDGTWRGGNITAPLKQEAWDQLHKAGAVMSSTASMLRAVNTVLAPGDGAPLRADNTDWVAIAQLLCETAWWPQQQQQQQQQQQSQAGVSATQPALIVLGAGGTARAAALAGVVVGCQVLVWNRGVARAAELQAWADEAGLPLRVFTSLSELQEAACSRTCGLMSTLPATAGDTALQAAKCLHDAVALRWVMEASYMPSQHSVASWAQSMPAIHVATGASMLALQGERAFRVWTGKAAPIQVMAEAVHAHLLTL